MKRKLLVIAALAVFGLITIAASNSSTFYSVWIKHNRTSPYLFKITDSSSTTPFWVANSGTVTVSNNLDLSGATLTPSHDAVAILSGSTGTVPWGYFVNGTSVSPNSATGNSGWILTPTILAKYKTFLVETQHPGGAVSGASFYSSKCPSGVSHLDGGTGETIYLTDSLTSAVHGMEWTFINKTGTTPFVLYDKNSLIRTGAGAGTTESPVTTTNRGCEDVGDSVTIRAVYFPITSGGGSGWYVTNIWNYD